MTILTSNPRSRTRGCPPLPSQTERCCANDNYRVKCSALKRHLPLASWFAVCNQVNCVSTPRYNANDKQGSNLFCCSTANLLPSIVSTQQNNSPYLHIGNERLVALMIAFW